MALQDLLNIAQHKKIGLSEERVMAVMPIIRKYAAFWREYPDLFIDFLIHGEKLLTGEITQEEKEGKFHFFFYQRVFLRSIMRYQYVYCVFPRALIYSANKFFSNCGKFWTNFSNCGNPKFILI